MVRTINLPNGRPAACRPASHSSELPRYARGWFAAALVACLMLTNRLPVAWAQADVVNREYPLKALFLYNFGGYVEWPVTAFLGPDQPFVIGVLGPAPLLDTLSDIAASKKIGQRRIVIQHFLSVEAIRSCQILFVTRGVSPQEQRQAVEKLVNQPVLIVGESDGFARSGGTVNFFVESNKIRFEINPEAARQQQLKISSKLLALARIVQSRDAASR